MAPASLFVAIGLAGHDSGLTSGSVFDSTTLEALDISLVNLLAKIQDVFKYSIFVACSLSSASQYRIKSQREFVTWRMLRLEVGSTGGGKIPLPRSLALRWASPPKCVIQTTAAAFDHSHHCM
jgi:hypothetical protein